MDNEALRKECMKSRDDLLNSTDFKKHRVPDYVVKNFVRATDRYLTNIIELDESILKQDALYDKQGATECMVVFMDDINTINTSVITGKFFKEENPGSRAAVLADINGKELAEILRTRSQYYRMLNNGLYKDARELLKTSGVLLKDSYDIAPRDPNWHKEEEKAMKAGRYTEGKGNARFH